jgi:O-antigen ligase
MKNTAILKGLIIGGLFASLIVPFITISDLYFPFITGKAYAFRVLVEVIFGLWLVLAIFDKQYRPKKTLTLISFVVFLVVMFFANLQGLNPAYSFWSNYERMEGYVTLVHVFAYFVVLSSVFNTKKIWNVFLNSLVVSSVIQAFYSFMQAGGQLEVGMTADRVDGTLGNATYLAGFMLLSAFITVYLWMNKKSKTEFSGYLHAFYGLSLLMQSITIFLTATRGAMLGLIFGLFVGLAIYLFLEPKRKILKLTLAGLVTVVVIATSLIFNFKDSEFVQNTVALRRISEISAGSGTVQARFINWGIAFDAFKERPLLGYGQGNFGPIFDKNYDVRLWSQEQWFDRAHNLFFDWIVAGGLLGVLSYLSIVFFAIYYIWKPSLNFSNAEKSALTAFFVAYFIHTMFVFDNLTSYMLLFVVIALISSRLENHFGLFEKETKNKIIPNTLAVIVLLAIPYSAWAVNYEGYVQNRELIKAITIKSIDQVPGSFNNFKLALNIDSYGQQEALIQLLSFGSKINESKELSEEIKKTFYETILSELERYYEKNPKEARLSYVAGQYIAQSGNYDLAIDYFDEAIALAPNKQSIYNSKIETLLFKGMKKESLDLVKQVYEINPENDNFWNFYINFLSKAGEPKLQSEFIEEAFQTGKAYRVINLAKRGVETNPDNMQAYVTLALSYYRSGNQNEAVETLNVLTQRLPQFKAQVDPLIKSIQSGEKVI